MGFKVVATGGTQRYFMENGLDSQRIFKVHEGRPNIVDAIKNGEINIVINTTEGAKAHSDSASIRRTALLHHVPYYTTIAGVDAVTKAIDALKDERLDVVPIQDYIDSPQ
jgi:carbamoyl-phosphate synthase large subunit